MKLNFKVWDKDFQSFLDNAVFIDNDGDVFLLEHSSQIVRADESLEIVFSTGIRDKNNALIYQGDVVHFKASGLSGKGFVYWNEALGQWWIKDTREATKKRGQRYYPFYEDAVYRIDGNIYEDPHFLNS